MSEAVGRGPRGDSLAADIRSAVISVHCQGLVRVSEPLRLWQSGEGSGGEAGV